MTFLHHPWKIDNFMFHHLSYHSIRRIRPDQQQYNLRLYEPHQDSNTPATNSWILQDYIIVYRHTRQSLGSSLGVQPKIPSSLKPQL